MVNNNFNQSNDYQSKINAFYDNKDRNQLEQLRLKYSTVPNYKNMSLRDELQTRFDLNEMNNLEKRVGAEKSNIERADDYYRFYIDRYLPNTFVQSYDVLKKAKDEMDLVNIKNADNYYHSVAMCENT